MKQSTYDKIFTQSKKVATYSSIIGLLNWDQETYMPGGAINVRSAQLSLLSGLVHKEQTSSSFSKNLFSLISQKTGKISKGTFSKFEKRSLQIWREDYIKNVKLPNRFVQTFSETTSQATQAWIEAKDDGDFKKFAPHLKKIVDLCRKKADLLGYKDHPYDALVDIFEPGMTAQVLDKTFHDLKLQLVELLTKIEKKEKPNDSFLHQEFAHDQQLEVSNALTAILKINKKHSRLDESAHPFTLGLHPHDTRFTTWIKSKNVMSNILGTLHEGGHALYELNLPIELYGTPICESASIAIHESQSRFFETFLGKSRPFWTHFYPQLQSLFSKELKGISLDEFYPAINIAEATKIRVEADELTYCLHIILRYEMEKQIIEGSLSVDDIPEAWAAKTKELLHLNVSSDKEGCLQDIHWSMGIFGYFPTYALGNLYAAILFEKLKQDIPHWEDKISQGSLDETLDWMRTNIHQNGRYYLPQDLIHKVTGKNLSAEPYVKYLNEKFSSIYGV